MCPDSLPINTRVNLIWMNYFTKKTFEISDMSRFDDSQYQINNLAIAAAGYVIRAAELARARSTNVAAGRMFFPMRELLHGGRKSTLYAFGTCFFCG